MNKKEFLNILSANLRGVSREEKKDIISDFEEHFQAGLSEGRTEEDLGASLGDPKILAKQMKANVLIEKAEKDTSAGNIARAVFASLGLGFLNLLFILGPFIVIIAVILALFAIAVAITSAGITGFFGTIFSPIFPEYITLSLNPAVGIFGSITVICFGLLFFVGVLFLAKGLYRLFIKYIKFNVKVVTGKENK